MRKFHSMKVIVLGLVIIVGNTCAFSGMPLNKSRHRTCDHNLKITNLQPFDSGCTLVQWSDKSSCFSNDPAVNYTLEVLRSCSDQTSPLFIMELTNSTSTDHKTIAFNASMYNIAKPFHLRVKAESEEFWWKSRCYAIHRDLRVNTTFCAANTTQLCVIPDLRTTLCDRDQSMILPHYYLDSERQFFLENIIGSNLPAGDCYSLNASNYTVFHGKCDYNTARVNCRRHCDVLSVPEILWRTVYLLTDDCEKTCLMHLEQMPNLTTVTTDSGITTMESSVYVHEPMIRNVAMLAIVLSIIMLLW